MTIPTLNEILEGRRKWLETFASEVAKSLSDKAARDIVDEFQGVDEAGIFEKMKTDYLMLLHRTLSLEIESRKPRSLEKQTDYLVHQLAQLEAWKKAGFPA